MTAADLPEIYEHIDKVLRPLGITRSMRSYRMLCDCILQIFDREDRLESAQKEIYLPVSASRSCDWSAVQSAVRRAAGTAWRTNPAQLQKMAGYPLTGCPSAVQFLEIVYTAVLRS